MALIVAIGSLAVRAFGLTKAANYAISLVGRTTVCVRSTSNCQTTSVCNTHTLDCGGPAVHPQRLSHHRCEPGEHEHCQHLVRETMAELKHILDGAARRRANM